MFRRIAEYFRSIWYKKNFEICILGLSGAGKTTLAKRLVGGTFDSQTAPTVGFALSVYRKGRCQIKLWDVAGQERYRTVWVRYARSSSSLIFCVDASAPETWQEAGQELRLLLELIPTSTTQMPALLVVTTKNDLARAQKDPLVILAAMGIPDPSELTSVRTVGFYACSSVTGSGTDRILKWLDKYGQGPRQQRQNNLPTMEYRGSLVRLFDSIVSEPNSVSRTRETLKQAQLNPNYLAEVVSIICDHSVPVDVIRTACINASDFIQDNWCRQTDRDVIVGRLIQELGVCSPVVLNQLCMIFCRILEFEIECQSLVSGLTTLLQRDSVRGLLLGYFAADRMAHPLEVISILLGFVFQCLTPQSACDNPHRCLMAGMALKQCLSRLYIMSQGVDYLPAEITHAKRILSEIYSQAFQFIISAGASYSEVGPDQLTGSAAAPVTGLLAASSMCIDQFMFDRNQVILRNHGPEFVQYISRSLRVAQLLIRMGMNEVLIDSTMMIIPDVDVTASAAMCCLGHALTMAMDDSAMKDACRQGLQAVAQSELVPLLVSFLQITEQNEEQWMNNPDSFVNDTEEDFITPQPRIIASECLFGMARAYPDFVPVVLRGCIATSLIESQQAQTTDPHWWRRTEAALHAAQILLECLLEKRVSPDKFDAETTAFFGTMGKEILAPLTASAVKSAATLQGGKGASMSPLLLSRVINLAAQCPKLLGSGEAFLDLSVRVLGPGYSPVLRIAGAKSLCAFMESMGSTEIMKYEEPIVMGLRDMLNTNLESVCSLAVETLTWLAHRLPVGSRHGVARLTGHLAALTFLEAADNMVITESVETLMLTAGEGSNELAVAMREEPFPAIYQYMIQQGKKPLEFYSTAFHYLYILCSSGGAIIPPNQAGPTEGPGVACPLSIVHARQLCELVDVTIQSNENDQLDTAADAVAMALAAGGEAVPVLLGASLRIIGAILEKPFITVTTVDCLTSALNLAAEHLKRDANATVLRLVIAASSAYVGDCNCSLSLIEGIVGALSNIIVTYGGQTVLDAAATCGTFQMGMAQHPSTISGTVISDTTQLVSARVVSGPEALLLTLSYFFWQCGNTYPIALGAHAAAALLRCPAFQQIPACGAPDIYISEGRSGPKKQSEALRTAIYKASVSAKAAMNKHTQLPQEARYNLFFSPVSATVFCLEAILTGVSLDQWQIRYQQERAEWDRQTGLQSFQSQISQNENNDEDMCGDAFDDDLMWDDDSPLYHQAPWAGLRSCHPATISGVPTQLARSIRNEMSSIVGGVLSQLPQYYQLIMNAF